jgi:ribose transport system permease protein
MKASPQSELSVERPSEASMTTDAESGRRRSPLAILSPKNIGAVYVWIVIIILFAIVAPSTFPTWETAKGILNEYSISGLMALALVVPLTASYFDLSVGYTLSLSSVLVAVLLNDTSWSPVIVAIVVMLASLGVGLLNAFVVVGLSVDSFIGTLGTGAILAALTIGISGNQTITGRVGGGFAKLASVEIGGLTLPIFYLLAAMLGIGYWLERTRSGRSLYAMGFDRETARLTGISVNRYGVISFVTSSLLAGFAGLVLASRVASASAETGPDYLIPAFSAAFLGATQFRSGRFNPWGAVLAVLLIGTGDTGLLLAGGPVWTPELFEGVVLIAAVGLTGFGQNAFRERLAILRARLQNNATATPHSPPPSPEGG